MRCLKIAAERRAECHRTESLSLKSARQLQVSCSTHRVRTTRRSLSFSRSLRSRTPSLKPSTPITTAMVERAGSSCRSCSPRKGTLRSISPERCCGRRRSITQRSHASSYEANGGHGVSFWAAPTASFSDRPPRTAPAAGCDGLRYLGARGKRWAQQPACRRHRASRERAPMGPRVPGHTGAAAPRSNFSLARLTSLPCHAARWCDRRGGAAGRAADHRGLVLHVPDFEDVEVAVDDGHVGHA